MKLQKREIDKRARSLLNKLRESGDDEVLRLIKRLNLNSNHIRDFYQLFHDLEIKYGKKKSTFIDELQLNHHQNIIHIKSLLTKTLYPTFTHYQIRLNDLLKQLKLFPYLTLELPRNFEGNEVNLFIDLSQSKKVDPREIIEITQSSAFQEINVLLNHEE